MSQTVQEIQEMLKHADEAEFEALERSLSADTRKGVVNALKTRRKQLDALKAEISRVDKLYEFDSAHAVGEGNLVVGLDEVGRGAVAGPLAVGAVVLDWHDHILGLNDSKKLSPERREELAASIKEHALAWTVCFIQPAIIDSEGMSRCLHKAFSMAIAEIDDKLPGISTVLLDGNPLKIDPREVNVVKGDAKSASIAAASIVAKVTRDALMTELSSTYPPYGFAHNKGYASEDHIDAIRKLGLSPVHRASFCTSFLQQTLF